MKFLLCLGLASIFPFTAHAQQFVKDGMYCISDICIGDDIATLTKINWKKVKTLPIKANNPIMKKIAGNLAAQSAEVILDAAPYIAAHQFDAAGIAKLDRVKGFCATDADYHGQFDSESGHPTYVTARIEPSADGSTQAIRVYSISRNYPAEYTTEQLGALTNQLTERYGRPKFGETDPSWGIGPDKVLFLRGPVDWDGGAKRRNGLKKYPGCGTALKID